MTVKIGGTFCLFAALPTMPRRPAPGRADHRHQDRPERTASRRKSL